MVEKLANLRSPNKLNYQSPGRMSLFFRKRLSTQDKDWVGLGDIHNHSIAPTIERLDHFSQRHGVRALDRSIVTERNAQLNFDIHEVNLDTLRYAFSSSETPVVGTLDVPASRTYTNPGGGNTIILPQVDLKPGSLILRSVLKEEVDEVTFTEGGGNDYTFDPVTGTITILSTGVLDDPDDPALGHKQVHAFWFKNLETQRFTIWDGTEVEGEAIFNILTKEGIKYVFVYKSVIIQNNGDITWGDGSEWQTISLAMRILVDDNGDLGFCHVINDDELD